MFVYKFDIKEIHATNTVMSIGKIHENSILRYKTRAQIVAKQGIRLLLKLRLRIDILVNMIQ